MMRTHAQTPRSIVVDAGRPYESLRPRHNQFRNAP